MPVVFGKATMPCSARNAAHLDRRLADHLERRAGRRVEVDPQLVGVLRGRRTVRPRVEAEAPLVGGPQHVGDVGHHDRPRLGAVDGGDGGRLQPLGRAVGDPLLEEVRPGDPVGPALQQRRPAAHGPHQWLVDGDVVAGEVELGLAVLGEHHLARAGDRDGPPGDVDVDRLTVVGLGHRRRQYRRRQPSWRAALRPPQEPVRWRATTAPVWLWRMNSIPLMPDSSLPLTTSPSGRATSVPAVT